MALGSLLLVTARSHSVRPDAVVAVPLHRDRLFERGYNQAALLAGIVARSMQVPDWSEGLIRVRATERQSAQPGRAERLTNLSGAFALERSFWRHWPDSLTVAARPAAMTLLLIDDVMTTGATLAAAAQPLHQAGFSVMGLVVASDSNLLAEAM